MDICSTRFPSKAYVDAEKWLKQERLFDRISEAHRSESGAKLTRLKNCASGCGAREKTSATFASS